MRGKGAKGNAEEKENLVKYLVLLGIHECMRFSDIQELFSAFFCSVIHVNRVNVRRKRLSTVFLCYCAALLQICTFKSLECLV